MSISLRLRSVAGTSTLTVIALGAGMAAGSTNPAAAANALAAVESAVSCATSTACVSGANTSTGPGVTGTSKKGTGITASGVAGLAATGTTGAGLTGISNSSYGVTGTSNSNVGVKGVSNGYYGVSGTSNKSYGIAGTAVSTGKGGVFGSAAGVSAAGVYGTNSVGGYGVYGIAPGGGYGGVWGTTTSGSGYGVVGLVTGSGIGTYGGTSSGTGLYGFAGSGNGVEGISSSGIGVYAVGTGYATALYASSNTGYGVEALSNGQPSIFGKNFDGHGGDMQGTDIGVVGRAPASGGYPFVATDENGNDVFFVTGSGSVYYSGNVNHFTRISGGAFVKSYAPVSSAPTVEDTGSAQLVAGAAAVRLDPTFAASIDATTPYHVFLTPDGDTRGLYVAARTPAGFIVRETQSGRSTLTFEYRIVAASRGQANQRMAVVNSSEFARAPLTPATKVQPANKPLSQVPAPPGP